MMSRFDDSEQWEPRGEAGWTVTRVTEPSDTYAANGIRFGPDGRLYVAQLLGNRISALDVDSLEAEVIIALGGPIAAPDDFAFDSHGVMYVADNMPGRVWARSPNGEVRLIADGITAANGITCHDDRVFVNECRPEGRLLEIYPDGRPPRVMVASLMTPNAMAVGPDGLLYFPLVALGEVWRIALDGGAAEPFIDGLVVPSALKFDLHGTMTITGAATGEIVAVDMGTREKTTVAKTRPGLDNLAFDAQNRLFVSHFVDGGITEILPGGGERYVVPGGLTGPAGLAAGTDGTVWAADGASLVAVDRTGSMRRAATMLDHGFPGVVRGLAADVDGSLYVTTTAGDVASYDPATGSSQTLASGLDELMGLAVAADGGVVVAEAGAGRVVRVAPGGAISELATNLSQPAGIALSADGSCLVSEAGAGRVVRLDGTESTVVIDGLQRPQGLAVADDQLFVVDVGAKEVVIVGLMTGERETAARHVPVGDPPGRQRAPLPGVLLMPGPLSAFSDLTVTEDGTVYLAADGEGSIVTLRRG